MMRWWIVLPVLLLGVLAITEWPLRAGPGHDYGVQQDNGAAVPGKNEAQGPKNPKEPIVIEAGSHLFAALNETIDTKDFQQELSLREVVVLFYEVLNARKDIALPIIFNERAFKEEHPNADDISDARVRFPPIPRSMTVAAALRWALAAVPTKNATFVVKGEFIEITTKSRATIQAKLAESVVGDFKGSRVADVLGDLSAQTGCTIVVDERAVVESNRIVSIRFRGDVRLAAAARAVADQVDLKTVVLDDLLYVTTSAHAAQLQKELQDSGGKYAPLSPNDLK
jgi:hypothetical protein